MKTKASEAPTQGAHTALATEETQPPLKVGVVGVGYLGMHHARLYSELEGCELVGICEPNAKAAAAAAKKFKCAVFETPAALAAQCQGISIVTPTPHHHSVALEILNTKKPDGSQGAHLMIEKPICTSLQEAEAILNAADAAGKLVQVGHVEHFNPAMDVLRSAVNAPRYITAERLAPFNPRGTEVGVVLDLMIHDIGVVLELVNSPVQKVDAVGVPVVSGSEDIANARITFENGCVANLSTSRISQKKQRKIRVFQQGHYLSLDFLEQKGYLLELPEAEAGKKPSAANIKRRRVPVEKGEPLRRELQAFINSMRSGTQPLVSGVLGREALNVAIQISEQLKTN